MPIEHEGKTYYDQTEMESTVKDRLRVVGGKVTDLEASAKSWEAKYQEVAPRVATADTLAAQLAEAQRERDEAKGAYGRYQAATGHGITDAESVWALEQAHTRAMGAAPTEAQVDFGAWLNQVKTSPDLAPAYLRMLFQSEGPTKALDPKTIQAPGAGPKAPEAPPRPAWAPSVSGQRAVEPGQQTGFQSRVSEAKTMEDILALRAEQMASRRR